LVVDGGGWAGEVIDFIDLDVEREANVVSYELEVGVLEKVMDVILGACEEVIDAYYLVTIV